ncbi:protein MAINTENANCE OF MERISTEMS-like isoform X1 [Corylus avellana]|uniref:protein MAINTENANCE OF MERISTEMS-like isoform X1 n=1 Tax=Corylus avellana TaxID=13451 RepID=UPI00286D5DAB|nr:protein MAINTENANCE OF MERISTEMS-like isoform X1 [Corylus avellana]
MGFGNLLEMPSHRLRKNLLVELMEKWSCEKLAFELMPGEIPITRMDVALILGLRVVGKPVVLIDEEPFTDIEKEYGAVLWKRKITVASLQSRLDALGGVVNDDFVRTFILFIFGTFLFPNANGKVNSRYLSYLKNLDDFCHYAWGAAVVDDIVSWLNKRKETNIQYVGGCLIFLQIWSYEHINIARPALRNSCLTFPRICQWDNSGSYDRHWFATKFKDLEDHQVIWKLQPTSGELEIDLVRELMEEQYVERELLRPQHCSTPFPIVHGGNLRIRSQVMEQVVVGVKIESGRSTWKHESDTSIVNEVNMVKEIDSEQPKALENAPGTVTRTMDFPSTSGCMSNTHKEQMELNFSSNLTAVDEDDPRTRIRILEEQNMELKTEMENLRRENIILKDRLLLSSQLEEQNVELKKELDYLRRECLSSNNLVLRLERVLLDEDVNAAVET